MNANKKGELYALLISLLESFFPIITIYVLQSIGPLFAYSLSTAVASVFFVVWIALKRDYREFLVFEAYRDMLWLTFYITTLFILLMVGLQYTTAGNMSVIIGLQLFFSYLYFNVFGSEKMTKLHSFAALLMGVGAIIILFPEDFSLNKGDALIFLAAVIAPLVSKHQKQARTFVSAKTILAFRNIVAFPVVFVVALYMEGLPSVENIQEVWVFILLNGLLIFTLSKVLFVEALNLIPITKLLALLSFVPIFTLFFAYFLLDEVATMVQLMGMIPIVVGSYLITRPEEN